MARSLTLERLRRVNPALTCLLLLVGAAVYLSGCATMDNDRESDLPWNMPQPWESAPAIPGLEGR